MLEKTSKVFESRQIMKQRMEITSNQVTPIYLGNCVTLSDHIKHFNLGMIWHMKYLHIYHDLYRKEQIMRNSGTHQQEAKS